MTDETRPWDSPAHPTNTASPEALSVLLAMADWKVSIKHAEIVLLTHLDSQAVSYALRGLKQRGRVVVDGAGPHATWRLAHRQQAAA